MMSKTQIKSGQRVRAEWPHGAAVENEAYIQLGTQKLVFDIPALGGVLTMPIDELPSSVKVGAISEPLDDKPAQGTRQVAYSDRRVHAVLDDGSELVRYDKAGKWFREPTTGKRVKLDIKTAARLAAPARTVNLGLPGGSTFDALVRKIRAGEIE